MEKIRAHFLKYPPRVFVFVTVTLLIITDLLNSWYLTLYWDKKNFAQLLIQQSIRRSGLLAEDFNPDTINEMLSFMNNTFHFFLVIILANNFFFYFFYLQKKLWAQGFVLFYTLTAAMLAVTFVFDNAELGAAWFIYNAASFLLYVYLYFGVKVLKPETTLERGKKGR